MASETNLERRALLKGATLGGVAIGTPAAALAQGTPATASAPAAAAPGYAFLDAEEAAFVEALADTMVPADALSPKGTDIGINTYIDRALAGAWGQGDRLYMQGPWKTGTPNQGYQLPLTPAALYRAGIRATNAHCRKTYGKPFDAISEAERNAVLTALDRGQLTFENGPAARVWWGVVYQSVMEGLFSDPIHGGNREMAGWKLVGFPGVMQNNRNLVQSQKGRRYAPAPMSIADMS